MRREGPRILAGQMAGVLEVGGACEFAREAEGDSVPEDGIVVEGRITGIDQNSRAKRWNMLAGRTAVEVERTVEDVAGNLRQKWAGTRLRRAGGPDPPAGARHESVRRGCLGRVSSPGPSPGRERTRQGKGTQGIRQIA